MFLIFPAISLTLIFAPLLFYFKGEETEVIIYNLRYLVTFLVPTSFTYISFGFYDIIKYISIIGFIEELRRFIFLGEVDLGGFNNEYSGKFCIVPCWKLYIFKGIRIC